MFIQKVEVICEGLVDLMLECDGLSRVLQYELEQEGIHAELCMGELYDQEGGITHMWLRLKNGHYVDYRARMWMGDTAPEGVFKPEDYSDYRYVLMDIVDNPISKEMYDMLISSGSYR